jgi:hypothetical protein
MTVLLLWLLCIFALKKSIHLPFAPYILWILSLPFAWLVTILCWLTNPIACLFPSRQPNGRDKLWGIFELWSTYDAPVDEGYYGKYTAKSIPQDSYDNSKILRYLYRFYWLSRNTGYGWSYLLFSIPHGTGFQWKGIAPIKFWFFRFKFNNYNLGYKSHAGFDKDDIACRPLGLRKTAA